MWLTCMPTTQQQAALLTCVAALTVSMGLCSRKLPAKRHALWSTHLLLELFHLITLSKALPASNERGIGVQQHLLRVPSADERMAAGSVSSSILLLRGEGTPAMLPAACTTQVCLFTAGMPLQAQAPSKSWALREAHCHWTLLSIALATGGALAGSMPAADSQLCSFS